MKPSDNFVVDYLLADEWEELPIYDTKEDYEEFFGDSLDFDPSDDSNADKLEAYMEDYLNNHFKVVRDTINDYDLDKGILYRTLIYKVDDKYYSMDYTYYNMYYPRKVTRPSEEVKPIKIKVITTEYVFV